MFEAVTRARPRRFSETKVACFPFQHDRTVDPNTSGHVPTPTTVVIEEPVGEEPVGIEELISRNLLELMMS